MFIDLRRCQHVFGSTSVFTCCAWQFLSSTADLLRSYVAGLDAATDPANEINGKLTYKVRKCFVCDGVTSWRSFAEKKQTASNPPLRPLRVLCDTRRVAFAVSSAPVPLGLPSSVLMRFPLGGSMGTTNGNPTSCARCGRACASGASRTSETSPLVRTGLEMHRM